MVSITNLFPDDPPPVNSLISKWEENHPPTPKPEYSQVCDGYSCMWCGRCPKGSYWTCPEEDLDEYRQYALAFQDWADRHPGYLDMIVLEVGSLE